MSRAFVREVDEARPSPMLERPVSTAPNLVAPRGARLIEQTVVTLEEQIAAASDDVPALRRDLHYWSARRATLQIVPTVQTPANGRIWRPRHHSPRGGAHEIYIVGEDEADPAAGLDGTPFSRASRRPSWGNRGAQSGWTCGSCHRDRDSSG
jgi:hypothetical protein